MTVVLWMGVKEIRAAGIDSLLLWDLVTIMRYKGTTVWFVSVIFTQPLMRQNGPQSIKLKKDEWDKELSFRVITPSPLCSALRGAGLRKRKKPQNEVNWFNQGRLGSAPRDSNSDGTWALIHVSVFELNIYCQDIHYIYMCKLTEVDMLNKWCFGIGWVLGRNCLLSKSFSLGTKLLYFLVKMFI